MVQRQHLEDFIADADGGGFVAGEEGHVFGFVEEVALETEEMGGEEDVAAEGGEEVVELGGRCDGEMGKTTWVGVS